MNVPLLRSPPFDAIDADVSRPGPCASNLPLDADAIDRLFMSIREARIGGQFWSPQAKDIPGQILVRAMSVAEIGAHQDRLGAQDRAPVTWVLPAGLERKGAFRRRANCDIILSGDYDPWSLLKANAHLFAHGDDEWVALAHIAGSAVTITSAGRFGAAGAAEGHIRDRVVKVLSQTRYVDPFTGKDALIQTTIAQLADWRALLDANRSVVAACGIAWWKRHDIRRFLWTPNHVLRYFRSEKRALRYAARRGGAIAVWPSRISSGMANKAQAQGVELIRIEDGFVRSVGLGSNLVPPSSVAVDRLGIHYDPTKPSDLEKMLAHSTFPAPLLARAKAVRETVVEAGISKYGGNRDHVFPQRRQEHRLVLVAGQVEDDMSVRLGGGGLASNLELLRRARALEPDAEIWFRPHPDIDAGHRKGAVQDSDALLVADHVVRGGSMARLLELVDAVHVLTSLTGFEALLREREVTCHGVPFYAGWGLTRDLAPVPERRQRRLLLDELVAAVLIVYPRYLDPVTGLPCPPEVLIGRVVDLFWQGRPRLLTRLRQIQGRLSKSRLRA